MRVADLDFELPQDRIALRPAEPRDSARLLLVAEAFADKRVSDLPRLLRRGDVLVFNDTKVIPASLSGVRRGRSGTTAKVAVLLHQRLDAKTWKAFARPAKKLGKGDIVDFQGLVAQVAEKGEEGEVTLAFETDGTELNAILNKVGRVPLPPYIESKRPQDARDGEDYQTMFADKPGAVAAPTASLHFTPNLMNSLQQAEIKTELVTLHVGAGTFLPIKVDDTAQHKMHSEWGEISAAASNRLRQAKVDGRRIIPVGTTALRLLEASQLKSFSGTTDIFITPGYRFGAADGLMTNFHLPRSTLFALVAAFAGLDRMRAAYEYAIRSNYRFYSYGDASLLWPQQ
jgi:S-adenosylmethionine:tRNA ribosyltransferase-isomerase